MERIIYSAIWYKDLPTQAALPKNCNQGIVIIGSRHAKIIKKLFDDGIFLGDDKGKTTIFKARTVTKEVGEFVQGFLTSHNRFVGRQEAAKLAFHNGQIGEPKEELFSEDLW